MISWDILPSKRTNVRDILDYKVYGIDETQIDCC